MENLLPGSTLVDIFLTCLGTGGPQRDRLARLTLPEWQQLLEMGQHNLVPGLLSLKIDRAMGRSTLPEEIRQALRDHVRQTAVLNMKQTGEMLVVLKDLAAAGIDVILLKGAYLRLGIYSIPNR